MEWIALLFYNRVYIELNLFIMDMYGNENNFNN